MAKKSETKSVVIDHRQVMAATTKALGEGRMAAFREDPSEENIDAIANRVKRNLTRLSKGKSFD